MLNPTRGLIRKTVFGQDIRPMQPPINCKIGKELAGYMTKGLVDRFLEYGYLSMIIKHSKEYTPIYTFQAATHVEEVKIHVMPKCFTIYRDKVDGDDRGIYFVTVKLDMHFNVTDVEIESTKMAFIDVATDLHRVLTGYMNQFDTFGKAKNPTPQEKIDC
jgi:hypothetical protein